MNLNKSEVKFNFHFGWNDFLKNRMPVGGTDKTVLILPMNINIHKKKNAMHWPIPE